VALICAIITYLAMLWYSLSYIPYARQVSSEPRHFSQSLINADPHPAGQKPRHEGSVSLRFSASLNSPPHVCPVPPTRYELH
jgi:hypothetical protein